MVTVGIPRALLYYQYYPMWRTFFEYLGAKVVLSSVTSRAMVAAGSNRMVAETCLPTKIFCGHVISLAGQCDYVFIPAIRSIEGDVYNCSKFLGLPDLVRAVVPECPLILEPDIDVNKGQRALYLSIYSLGRKFTPNPLRVKQASQAAWKVHQEYVELMRQEKLTPLQAVRQWQEDDTGTSSPPTQEDCTQPGDLAVGLIGHPYLIYDEYVNHRLVHRLQNMRVVVQTPEMITEQDITAGIVKLVGRRYWTYEDEVVGAGGHFLENQVDGVISVVAFGCGPDSVMIDVIQRHAKHSRRKPFMSLVIDEHTAEAGLITRLEAFVDMLRRRKKARGEI